MHRNTIHTDLHFCSCTCSFSLGNTQTPMGRGAPLNLR